MLFGILGRKENFLPKQLPFCLFILFFNFLKNRQKSNFTLYCGEKKFPLSFPSNIGRIKNYGTHQFFFLHIFLSIPFSFLPHQIIHFYIFHLKIYSNFFFLPIFTSTKRTLRLFTLCTQKKNKKRKNSLPFFVNLLMQLWNQ